MAGHITLDDGILVRIQAPQLRFSKITNPPEKVGCWLSKLG